MTPPAILALGSALAALSAAFQNPGPDNSTKYFGLSITILSGQDSTLGSAINFEGGEIIPYNGRLVALTKNSTLQPSIIPIPGSVKFRNVPIYIEKGILSLPTINMHHTSNPGDSVLAPQSVGGDGAGSTLDYRHFSQATNNVDWYYKTELCQFTALIASTHPAEFFACQSSNQNETRKLLELKVAGSSVGFTDCVNVALMAMELTTFSPEWQSPYAWL
jgi:hypothetical protein